MPLQFFPFQFTLRKIKWSISKNPFPYTVDVINRGCDMINSIEDTGFSFKGKTAMEIGCGWEPVIPVLLYLKGCSTIYLYDLHRLLNEITLKHCIETIMNMRSVVAKKLALPEEDIHKKLSHLSLNEIEDALQQVNTHYHAPANAACTCQPNDSVDFIYSHTVFEHIPVHVLKDIMRESYRILSDDGLSCHYIDNSDHWAQHDSSITTANFLKYSNSMWNLLNINALDYQNRLRSSDFDSLFNEAGFSIVRFDSSIDDKAVQFLKKSQPARRYERHSLEDLARIGLLYVLKKNKQRL
jgi:hypothetical protein